MTEVRAALVDAGASTLTGVGVTRVDARLTVGAGVARGAVARVAVLSVDTPTSVQARAGRKSRTVT